MLVNLEFFVKYTKRKKEIVLNYIQTNFGENDLNFFEIVNAMTSSNDRLLEMTAELYLSNLEILMSVTDEIAITNKFRVSYSGKYLETEDFEEIDNLISLALEDLIQITGAKVSYIGIRKLDRELIKERFLKSIGLEENQVDPKLLSKISNSDGYQYQHFDDINQLIDGYEIEIFNHAKSEKIIVSKEQFYDKLNEEKEFLQNYLKKFIVVQKFVTDKDGIFKVWKQFR